jgi:FKBP-type peptidyl-prolyl cis-trans isomerase FkpA
LNQRSISAKATAMRFLTQTPLRLLLSTALLALPLSASDAAARTAKRPAPVRRPAAPNNSIIVLPLMPTVPAGQRACSAKDGSGLGYTVLRAGSGAKPGANDTVLINYIGYLAATGAVFDQNTRSPLPVDGVIAGFSQGLQMMGRSGIVRLCIPAALGYGARGSGPVPANADLVFQVELLDFKTTAEMEQMRQAQAAQPEPPPDTPSPQ